MIPTYLVVASITDEAHRVLIANGATITVLREKAPHLELVSIPHVVYHGRHPQAGYVSYTLNSKTGDGICFWDSDPLTCQLYRWSEQPEETTGLEFAGINGQIWPAGLSGEQMVLRTTVAGLCEEMLQAHPLPKCNAWAVQIDWLNERASELLHTVAPLLPDGVRVLISKAIQHQQQMETPAPEGTPTGDIGYLEG